MRRLLLLAAVPLTALLAPAAASADAVVSLPPTDGAQAVLVKDVSGEANRLDVDNDATTIRIEELAAGGIAIDPSAAHACTLTNPALVTCVQGETYGLNYLELDLGPGDDATLTGTGALHRHVLGGPGDDVLRGAAGYDRLTGGEDDDTLVPGTGDEELRGGPGEDLVDYDEETRPVTATIPDEGALTRLGPDQSDTIFSDVEGLRGGEAGDDLSGSPRADTLDGGDGADDLRGSGGDDELFGGPGPDTLWGGGDADHLDAADGEADAELSCGPDEDTIDADNAVDPAPADCETIAPEIETPLAWATQQWKPGFTASLLAPTISGTPPATTSIDWMRCGDGACQTVLEDTPTRTIAAADAGRSLVAILTVANAAGSDQALTDPSPVVEGPKPPAPGPGEGTPGPKPGADRPGGPPPTPEPPVRTPDEQRAAYRPVLATSLAALVRRARATTLRRLARRGFARVAFAVPTYGTVSVRWTVPAKVARRHGLRAKGGTPVVVARGSATGRRATPAALKLKLTKPGRRLVRRAKRLRITVAARFSGGAAAKDRALVLRRTLTLRRS